MLASSVFAINILLRLERQTQALNNKRVESEGTPCIIQTSPRGKGELMALIMED